MIIFRKMKEYSNSKITKQKAESVKENDSEFQKRIQELEYEHSDTLVSKGVVIHIHYPPKSIRSSST